MSVIDDIAAERRRQIEHHGWSAEHDDEEHERGDLALAAACYATTDLLYREDRRANAVFFFDPWPWAEHWDKRLYDGNAVQPNHTCPYDQRRRQLVKAAALIVAEIERLDRQAATEQAEPS